MLSGSGGAQYGIGLTEDHDRLVVFAKAFDRDEQGDDFSLEAIIAHERGHQMIIRDPRLRDKLARELSQASEEILASLIGSVITQRELDQEMLFYKGVFDAVHRGMELSHAARLLATLRQILESIL